MDWYVYESQATLEQDKKISMENMWFGSNFRINMIFDRSYDEHFTRYILLWSENDFAFRLFPCID
jgi:hypothetical protein